MSRVESFGRRSPICQKDAEVCTVDGTVSVDIASFFASWTLSHPSLQICLADAAVRIKISATTR